MERLQPLVAHVDPERPGVVTLHASVIGMSDPHSAYEVWLYVADQSRQLPDAWRFDAAGCQGSERVRISSQPLPALATGYLRKNAEPPYDELVHFEPGQNLVSYGDGEITPEATTTWGQIKGAYRR